MSKVTFKELRNIISNLFRHIINNTMNDIYNANVGNHSEKEWSDLIISKRDETKDFLEQIFMATKDSLSELYLNTDPVIVCCLYLRYWNLINIVEQHSHSPKNTITIPENEPAAFMRILLFAIAEGSLIA